MGTATLHYFENTSFQTNINYFLPRWKFKWIQLHFPWGDPVHECVNYRFPSHIPEILFWSYLVCNCKSGVSVHSCRSASHTMFKAFLVPSNSAVQCTRVSPHQNFIRIFALIHQKKRWYNFFGSRWDLLSMNLSWWFCCRRKNHRLPAHCNWAAYRIFLSFN